MDRLMMEAFDLMDLLDFDGEDPSLQMLSPIDDFENSVRWSFEFFKDGKRYGGTSRVTKLDIREDKEAESKSVLSMMAWAISAQKRPSCSWVYHADYLHQMWGHKTDHLVVAIICEWIKNYRVKQEVKRFRKERNIV